MKRFVILLMILVPVAMACGMTGGPAFCVGANSTSMNVVAGSSVYDLGTSGNEQRVVSQRGYLSARYGLAPSVDIAGTIGTANLNFTDLPPGYDKSSSDWSVAWGGTVRLGLPMEPRRFQMVAVIDYLGFQTSLKTGSRALEIENDYLWHEVKPALLFGWKIGAAVPYVGVMKPYLFGRHDQTAVLRAQPSVVTLKQWDFSDGGQPMRALLGADFRLPDGYSIGAEAAFAGGGLWTVAVSLAQAVR